MQNHFSTKKAQDKNSNFLDSDVKKWSELKKLKNDGSLFFSRKFPRFGQKLGVGVTFLGKFFKLP